MIQFTHHYYYFMWVWLALCCGFFVTRFKGCNEFNYLDQAKKIILFPFWHFICFLNLVLIPEAGIMLSIKP